VVGSFFSSGFVLAFGFILSVDGTERTQGTEAWILVFIGIEIGEVLFIALPEEIAQLVD